MLILLLGKNGQVGWELHHHLAFQGDLLAFGREELDLLDHEQVRQCLRENKPRVIINAAAYTDVNRAEIETEKAMQLNGVTPGILAEEAKRINSLLIHYSTDYVFDGKADLPYTEEHPPSPINVYGQTKLAGEQSVQEAGGAYLILRTSWVYGMRGRNFLLTILRLSGEQDQIQVVNDQVGAPTWCGSIAEATISILSQILGEKDWLGKAKSVSGIYHYAAVGQTTWYGFAKAILEFGRKNKSSPVPQLIPIPTHQYPSPAHRPQFSVLSLDKIRNQFGILPSAWEEQLSRAWATQSLVID